MTGLLVAAALAAPAPARETPIREDRPAHQESRESPRERRPAPCKTRACHVRVARKQCDAGNVRSCVVRGALQHHQDPQRLIRVAWCESTLRPAAVNGQYQGLFQFGPALWGELRYAARSRFSAKWSSLAAGLAFRRNLSGHWECKG